MFLFPDLLHYDQFYKINALHDDHYVPLLSLMLVNKYFNQVTENIQHLLKKNFYNSSSFYFVQYFKPQNLPTVIFKKS